MKIHRFFIKTSAAPDVDLSSLEIGVIFTINDIDLIHQWVNVLRFEVGDQMAVFSNTGPYEYGVEFVSLDKKQAEIRVISKKEVDIESNRPIVAIVSALIKKDRYEWLLEKGTELGVSYFLPVIAEHSEERGSYKLDRFHRIVKEATEQSGQVKVPEVFEVSSLDVAIGTLRAQGFSVLVADFDGEPALDILSRHGLLQKQAQIAFLIGPEGGWGDRDQDIFKNNNLERVRLGQTVLRAETAGIAAASLVSLAFPFTK